MRGSDSNITRVSPVRHNNLQAGWLVVWHALLPGNTAVVTNPLSTYNAAALKNAGATALTAPTSAVPTPYATSLLSPGHLLMNTHGASRVEFMLGGVVDGNSLSIQAFGIDEIPMAEVQGVAADASLASTCGFPWNTTQDGQQRGIARGTPYNLEVAAETLLGNLTNANRDTYAALTQPTVDVENSGLTGYFSRRGPLYRTPVLLGTTSTTHGVVDQYTFSRTVRFDCRGAAIVLPAVYSSTTDEGWVLLGRFV